MSCYRFLLARSDRPGFLDSATIDQAPGATLIAWEYAERGAIELWREPWRRRPLAAANEDEAIRPLPAPAKSRFSSH